MNPSLGRIVLVRLLDGTVVPAIIVRVHDCGKINVHVFLDEARSIWLGDLTLHGTNPEEELSSPVAYWPPRT